MPTVPLKYVVSFSSQDDKHPVSNLIRGDGYKKWLSGPQEKLGQIEAVFQLEQPCIISYIDIGSIWCATLEIKVGRSEWPAGREFETLVYTVSLMTPTDCSYGRNPVQTQMFSSDKFCPDIAKRQWDRVKVVCRQPYKKATQFGLSFVRVKTSASVKVINGNTSSGAAAGAKSGKLELPVHSIQKHFLGKLENKSKASPDELKTRLLKISASSDGGVEHGDSLSRTAKLVLAAAGPKPKMYGATSTAPGGEKTGLFSSCVDQKYGPKFHEEIGQFLAKLNIDSNDLDSITLADVRHKFEKRKKRKLTKDEKREFITMAKEFLQDMFSKKARNETTSKPDSLAKPMNPVRKTPSIDSAKSSNSPKTVTNPLAAMKSCQGKMERNGTREITPSGKRRLNNSDERVTPPCKRVLTEKIMSVKQQMKSYEQSPGAGKPKSLPESIKEKISTKKSEDKLSAKKSAGLPGNMMTPTSPFEYHGLRGADLDMSDEMSENKQSPVTKVKNMEKSKLKCSENSKKNNVKNNMKERKDNVLGSPKPNFGNFGLDMPWSPAVNENKTPVGGVSSGAKSRGKSRGRGSTKGRGRGRSIKKIAFPSDLIQDDSDDSDTCYDLNIASPAEVKGQGRGRGKGRGRKNNKETHIIFWRKPFTCTSAAMPKMENVTDRSKASPDELKTRLLKISASSDGGVEHGDSLSQTAKLVLAAAGPKPKKYGATSTAPGGEKTGLFSSCVDQKYGPKFHEEIGQFLAKLTIESNDLDSITLADVRHKFEKRKKRKLTKDEKREFITMAKEFLQDMFSKKARNETTSKPDSSAKPMNPVRKMPSIDSAKTSSSLKETSSPLTAMKSCQGKTERNGTREVTPSGKRRLNSSDERVTPPCKRVLTEKIMSVKQQMKSYEQSPGAGKPKSLPESINEKLSAKKSEDRLSAKKSAGLPGNMMTLTSPFEYHGLRGADLDMSDEMSENKQSPVTKVKNMEKSKLKCSENSKKNNVKNNMKERKDNVLGSPAPNFGNFGLDMPWSPAVNENKTPVGGVSSGVKSRGKSRGRGSTRGRGRGRSIKKIAFPSNLIQDDSDTCYDLNIALPAEVKGQGRGRGKARGRKDNKETHIIFWRKSFTCTSPPMPKMENVTVRSKASPDELKTRLLKISVSSDGGVEHGDSLSRTAKLVLAAAGPKPKMYGATSTAPGGEKTGLFSSCVDQKYGPKFHEEIDQFLAKLNIDSNDLDSITLADVRHKFEKRKKRKLTKDEKREFITMATEFLQDMFSKKTRNETTGKPDNSAKPMNPVRKTPSIDSAKRSSSRKTVSSPLAAMKSCQGKMERNGTRDVTPSGKRRLNSSDERVTPPCKRVLTEKIISVKQQMKSYEKSPGAGKPKSLPESIKEKISAKKSEDRLSAKKSAGLPGNMMTPTSPFEYHGLRGADLDMSNEMSENKQSPVTKVKNMEKSKLKCSENSKKNNVKNNMKESKDNVLRSPKPNFGNFGLEMPWSPAVNEIKTPVGGVSSGVKSRGKSRGRGSTRGRGRGRSIKKIAFPSDLIQDDSDDSVTCYDLNIASPAEVKG